MSLVDTSARQKSSIDIFDPLATDENAKTNDAPPDYTWRLNSLTPQIRATIGLVVLDILAVWIAFAGISLARGTLTSVPWLIFASVLTVSYFILSPGQRTYQSSTLLDPFLGVRYGIRTMLFAISITTIIIFYAKRSIEFPRFTVGIGSVGAVALMIVFRYIFISRLGRLIGGSPFQSALILDGTQEQPLGDYSIVLTATALFDPEVHDPDMYHRLSTALVGIDRVVISCPTERRQAWMHALQGANIQGEIIIPELIDLMPSGMGPDHNLPSVIVASGPLTLIDRTIKRSFDLILATTAILVLAPIFLLTALAIKLDSPGPILFKQRRIGRGNQIFHVLKFRSMYIEKSDTNGNQSTMRDDDRITRIGQVIRKLSIDELPQFFNVMRGDMSIVGPRPHAIGSRAADKLFWEIDSRYWHRHAIRPGLTGLAQVRGYRGATIHEDDLRYRLQSDLEYLQGWSIWRDIKIILLTTQVIFHNNAY